MSEEALRRRLARERAKVAQLEEIIEDRTRELFLEKRRAEQIIEALPIPVLVYDHDESVATANAAAREMLGAEVVWKHRREVLDEGCDCGGSCETVLTGGIPVIYSEIPLDTGKVAAAVDLRERHALELQLRHAQKLEAVGALAAGIAHEINTPLQYVGDTLYFLEESIQDLTEVLEAVDDGPVANELAGIGWDELSEDLPDAFARANRGLERVAAIIRAMRGLAHTSPDARPRPADVNELVTDAATICTPQTRGVARVELELGTVPQVEVLSSDLGQVVLNLIVNASHAIGGQGRSELGRIVVRTVLDDPWVRIEVEDDGGGIPEHVRDRIFEPFFTTKEVGKGTGQGLALAHSIVVERHRGRIDFVTELGKGTTFRVWLPLDPAKVQAA